MQTKNWYTQLALCFITAGCLFLLVSGCTTVGPDYKPPQTNASKHWNNELKKGLHEKEVDKETLASWWKTFDDPILTSLIDMSVSGNLDLAMARATLLEARARRGLSRTGLYPDLDASGSYTRSKPSEDTSPTGSDEQQDLYQAGFDAGWELDIFGGVKRAVQAAQADLEAQEAGLRDVLVSLCAEVGLNYMEARTYQTRLDIAHQNLRIQQRALGLAESREQAGLGTELEVQQAKYNLADTRSRIPSLHIGLEAAKNRLAVLSGKQPGAVHQILKKAEPVPTIPTNVAVGVPAETLRRRPDVRQAERRLAGQTARIGESTADLYPRFRLLGSIGLETTQDTPDFFASKYSFWSIGPSISWNVFDAGAVRRNIEIQSARQEQELINYEKTVLLALEEAENAMVSFAREQERKNELSAAAHSAQKAERLANDNYKAGLVAFIEVLDAQKAVLTFQDSLAQSKGDVVSNLIALYKSLGGGWKSPESR